jgi:biofilm PGA synthesis N-glycosyltransferase PgaC
MFLIPFLAIFVQPLFLLGYLIDLPAIVVPVMYKAFQRKEVVRALASLPGFFVLRFVNAVFLLKALWLEFVMKRPLLVYEKGH